MTTRIDGGSSGEASGWVARPGRVPSFGGEQLPPRGRALAPARSPRRLCARNSGKNTAVSAVVNGEAREAREKRRGGRHGSAVFFVDLGTASLRVPTVDEDA